MIWQPIVLAITGVIALIIQNVYFLIDDREANHSVKDYRIKRNWHWAGGAIHIWMGCTMGMLFGWPWGLLIASLTWYFLDGFINSFVLRREWWYLGTTAFIDQAQRKIGNLIGIDHRLASAIVKHLFLIGSIVLLCLKK